MIKIIRSPEPRFIMESQTFESGVWVDSENDVAPREYFITYEGPRGWRVYKMLPERVALPRGAHSTLTDAAYWAAREAKK